jgi:undecaprenyl-diphosphatase
VGAGVLMIAIELLVRKPRTQTIEQTSAGQAITVGLAQIVAAVFPGTSRSAATILGGMLAGMSRSAAAEMSFFLAIPAMAAASGYKLLKFMQSSQSGLSLHQGIVLAVGTIVSFVVAWLVIALFMSYIRRHSFMPFAIYRIALGILVFLVMR